FGIANATWRSVEISKSGFGPGLYDSGSETTTEYPANGSFSRHTLYSERREKLVKPHGSLVPVSLTHHCASTPGLSTWSSTRSLQRSCDLGDLISWRVSRLDAFSVSPFRT